MGRIFTQGRRQVSAKDVDRLPELWVVLAAGEELVNSMIRRDVHLEEPLRAQQPVAARHQHRAWKTRSQARPVFVWRVAGATTTK